MAAVVHMKDYKKLLIWQSGMDVVEQTYKIAGLLPYEERYGLTSQSTVPLVIERLKLAPKEMIGALNEEVLREQRMINAIIQKIKSDGQSQ
jgi:hypothetical protein